MSRNILEFLKLAKTFSILRFGIYNSVPYIIFDDKLFHFKMS